MLRAGRDRLEILNLDGTLQFMTDSGLQLMETDDATTYAGKDWVGLWPEAARVRASSALDSARAGNTTRFCEPCPTAKGTWKWWDVIVSPVHGEAGEVRLIVSDCRDVTTEKIAEDQLRISGTRFRALADNIAQLAWMADDAGHIFWFNKRWFDYTGTKLEDTAGTGWQRLIHPEHADRVVRKFSGRFQRGEPWEDTFPILARDGSYRWFLSRALPITGEDGRVDLWCGTNTDVTEQRDASRRLRQKARLIEQSHEAILVWEIDGGIVFWNKGCRELYGFDQAEATGARSHDLLRTRHPMPLELFEAHLRESGSWSGELLHVAKDGHEVWVDSRQELLNAGDRLLVLETNRDITERRKADELRNLLLGELDHRVRNTLAIVQAIAGQTARVSNDVQQFTSSFNARLQALSNAHSVLTNANWSGARLRDLLNSQLVEIVQRQPSVELAGPDVVLSAQTALHLSLIVHELASNARKHGALTRARGRISIDWSIKPGDPALLHIMWIESNGPTVLPPVKQGFGSTLIERAGNLPNLRARLTYQPSGVRCDITIDLPASSAVPAAIFNPGQSGRSRGLEDAVQQSGPPVPPSRNKVLIIEDEPIIAMDVEEIISRAGYEIVGLAATVDSALSALASRTIDMVVLDAHLFGKPADRIADELVQRQIPFVVVSGASRETLPATVQNAPLVSKPLEEPLLIKAMAVLSGKIK